MDVHCPKGRHQAIFAFFCLWFLGLVVSENLILHHYQAQSPANLPFGVILADRQMQVTDFSYNRLFLEGVRHRIVDRPYLFSDQERLIRAILPGMQSGMTHAYSPVTLVLAQPILYLSGARAYLFYTSLGAIGFLLLLRFYLLRRAAHSLQVCVLLISLCSVWLATSFLVGQSVLLTVPLLGALVVFLRRRERQPSLQVDAVIALLFWALCFKPSVAIIPVMLLLGSRAWRILIFGAVLLLITWVLTAGFYGGWWRGGWDYLYLLSHYNESNFPPFLQRGPETALSQAREATEFSFFRALILTSSLALLLLRWFRRIDLSVHFQGMVWVFLLASPYLMPSENLILCLLVVEGAFFKSQKRFLFYGKLLLVAAIFDLRARLTFPSEIDYSLKWILFLWMIAEAAYLARWKSRQLSSPINPVVG